MTFTALVSGGKYQSDAKGKAKRERDTLGADTDNKKS